MDPHRRDWNQQQQALRQNLAHAETHAQAIKLFLRQHAMLHAAEMSNSGLWSFEDDILSNVTAQQMRLIPRTCDHSIAWLVWHMTRCEDITMNLLAAGSPQVLLRENWLDSMRISVQDTGNAMTHDQVEQLSQSMNLEALRSYRLAVGRRTRDIARQLLPGQMKRKVDPARLRQVTQEGAVVEAAGGLLEYWGGLTIAGLLLMPPTRHNFIHWNEALRIKAKIG